MIPLYNLLQSLLSLYSFLILIYCIFSFLYAFNILNRNDRIVYKVGYFLNRLCEPVLSPIRRLIPNLGGIDISPIIALLLIDYGVRRLLALVFFGSF